MLSLKHIRLRIDAHYIVLLLFLKLEGLQPLLYVVLHCFVGMLFYITSQVTFRYTEVLVNFFCSDFICLIDICLDILKNIERLIS